MIAAVVRAVSYRLLIVVAAVSLLCGAFSDVVSARALGDSIPAGTPTWLAKMIQRTEAAFGDSNPDTTVVRLGVTDRYGRRLDRVWMRGNFRCANCTTGLGSSAWQGRVIGFTVLADTHRLLSYSLHHG